MLLVLGCWLGCWLGCGPREGEVRPIAATTLLDCPLDGVDTLELEALDDSAPRASSFIEVPLRSALDAATLPSGASSFLARGRLAAGSLVGLGVLVVRDGRAAGPIYRASTACAFRDTTGARARFPSLLVPATGSDGRFAVAAGGNDGEGSARSDVIVIDGARATAERLGLRRRRAGAAAVIAGDSAVVIGGSAGSDVWEDAEVIDLVTRAVSPDAIALAEKRADAAAVLLASGEVLVVGGRGSSSALRTMEVLDPARRLARTIDVASLSRPRRSPRVVRLATGEILVMGGIDDASVPVPDIDVFDATAARRLATLPFAALPSLSAIALPSGAALIVHSDATSTRALLARADAIDAIPDPPHGVAPRLVAATDGAPFLFSGSYSRFDPFTQRFAPVALPAAMTPDTIEPFALDGGVMGVLRVEDGALAVRALRYALRPALVADAEALGLGSTEHLSPDRPGPLVGRDGLVITARARVAVTDATYRGVTLRLGGSGRDLPFIELRGEDGTLVLRVDDAGACAWPPASAAFTEVIRERDGAITLRAGDATRSCSPLVARDRVTVTLVAGTAEARVRGLTITRR